MQLNYDLQTDVSRLKYISTLPLDQYELHTIEYITNYILYGKQPSANTKDDNYEELNEDLNATQTRYTAPRLAIPWHHPELQPLLQAKNIISSLAQNPKLKAQERAKLKRWNRELSQDASPIIAFYMPLTNFPATYVPAEDLDISLHIDYTNSFHIKQLIIHYSALRQSDHSKYDIYYFETIIDATPLEDWQFHLLTRRIDGANQITIGIELAQQFEKIISPSYMSTAMRTIYKKIAKTAKQKEIEWADRDTPHKWKECPTCHRILHDSSYYWYAKRKACKKCEDRRKKNET